MRNEGTGGIRAQPHGNTVFQRRFRAGDDSLKDDVSVILHHLRRAREGTIEFSQRHRGGNGTDIRGVLLLEQPKELRVGRSPVLDRIHAVFQRRAHSFGTFRMRGDPIPRRVRFLAACPDIFGRHFQYAGLPFHFCVQNAARHHQFNPIRPICADRAHKRATFRLAVRGVRHRTRHMAVGNGNRHVGNQHPRPDNFSRRDTVADNGIKIAQSAHGTDRRHARKKLCFGVMLAQFSAQSAR